jgi:hypothetical protein
MEYLELLLTYYAIGIADIILMFWIWMIYALRENKKWIIQ